MLNYSLRFYLLLSTIILVILNIVAFAVSYTILYHLFDRIIYMSYYNIAFVIVSLIYIFIGDIKKTKNEFKDFYIKIHGCIYFLMIYSFIATGAVNAIYDLHPELITNEIISLILITIVIGLMLSSHFYTKKTHTWVFFFYNLSFIFIFL